MAPWLLSVLAPVFVVLIAPTAFASQDTFGDLPYIQNAINNALEKTRSGTRTRWSNPTTGNHGVVIPFPATGQHGEICRPFKRTWNHDHGTTGYDGIACRQQNGSWQVRSENPTAAPPTALPSGKHENREQVEVVQRLLADHGFNPGPVDGVFGHKTRTAIKEYQRQEGRETDGQLSESLIRSLKASASKKPARPPAGYEPAPVASQTPQSPAPAQPRSALGSRIALVIGNGAYEFSSPLRNPPNDARLMARTLQSVGFDVIEKIDANQRDMKLAINEFADRLDRAGGDAVGLAFYAGHGVQLKGQNYLIPVDAKIEREGHVDVMAVTAESILHSMEFANNSLNFLILDACRNNPYARSFRSAQRGLARMEARNPAGTLIAYATRPGDVAADGGGANSPYSAALAEILTKPGLTVSDVFIEVRNRVMAATKDQQVPWEEGGLTSRFYFRPGTNTATPPPISGEAPDRETVFWESIKYSDNPADFEDYLQRFPGGMFVGLATRQLEKLGNKKSVASTWPRLSPGRVTPDHRYSAFQEMILRGVMKADQIDFDAADESTKNSAVEILVTAKDMLASVGEVSTNEKIPRYRLISTKHNCIRELSFVGITEETDRTCDCMIDNVQTYFPYSVFNNYVRSGKTVRSEDLPKRYTSIIKLSTLKCLGAHF